MVGADVSTAERRRGGLWRDRDFMKFWSAETFSLLGSQVSLVAIPLLAVASLTASPFEMGVLNAAQFAPFLLLTLVAGVWVDKHRRLPMLIGTNFGRAVLFGLIPLAMALKLLNIGLLSALVFLAGMLTVVFELAYQSYLPSLVGHEHLIEGNGKLEGSRSFAQMSGPGTAGILVGAAGAPFAILIDAVTYLVSAVTLSLVRRTEPEPQPPAGPRKSLRAQIGHGLRLSVSNTYLRALGTEAAVYNLFNQMLWAVLILHLARGMHFHPTVVGLVLTTEGVGALLGSLVAARLGRRWGLGPTLIGSIVVANAAPLLIPAAPSGWVLAAPLIGVALLINGTGLAVYSIQAISLRQAAVTADILGRTNASYRFTVTGAAALGALIGGALGGLIGLRATMIVGGLGTLAAMCFVIRSPIPKLLDLSELEPDSASGKTGPATCDEAVVPDDIALTPIIPRPIRPNHLYARET
jgi:MFS family permease